MRESVLVGVIVLGGAAAAFAGYVWWQQHGQVALATTKEAIQDGAKFGTGKDRPTCVEEAVLRVNGVGSAEATRVRLFLTSCLKAAKPMATFCDDVPAETDSTKTASWQLKQSQRYGLKPPHETTVLAAIQYVCAGKELWLH